ncbi:hypothetical protein CROQUDRAFT_98551 [Cronartium quercuum f. sp. fusiforme G11]|uniref:Uncharacterized protein n=1 Tax=Cronartium quercuum f. sp. fusiforme G11 TaxID=708437 RepID=A0A9P6N8M2_9BASI|nr:hypothetical protein CROQUDRAFT_98551 [Cronartium quercuum f. sp. fusiforme G11]
MKKICCFPQRYRVILTQTRLLAPDLHSIRLIVLWTGGRPHRGVTFRDVTRLRHSSGIRCSRSVSRLFIFTVVSAHSPSRELTEPDTAYYRLNIHKSGTELLADPAPSSSTSPSTFKLIPA